jgi:hypothetical protein
VADSKTPSKPVIKPEQDSLLIEIEDDLRQDQYAKLWKKYGGLVIAGAVALVVGVAGFKFWQGHRFEARMEQGRTFAAAQELARQGQDEAARLALGDFAAKADPGYALLARLQEAAILGRKGDAAGAAAVYRRIAADGDVDPAYRDLAILLGAIQEIDTGNPADLIARLAPLTADTNPWRHSARELTAVLALASGDKAKARSLFEALSKDAGVPSGIGARAADMLTTLGSS